MSMVTINNPPMAVVVVTMLFIIALFLPYLHLIEAQVGVCNGRVGSNLPSPEQVVNLYKDNCITSMRLYEPHVPTLVALQGSDISLMLGIHNSDIPNIGRNQSAADEWVETYVTPYLTSIKYVVVGNEVTPSDKEASYVRPAMENIRKALSEGDAYQQTQGSGDIKVSTAIGTGLIRNSENAPSEAEFIDVDYISPIIEFLSDNDWPLLVNILPYLAYEKESIELKYLLFTAGDGDVLVTDRNNQLQYNNLFDAMCDSVYAAVGKVGVAARTNAQRNNNGVAHVVSESGAPSKKGFGHGGHGRVWLNGAGKGGGVVQEESNVGLSNDDANKFYVNLIEHVKQGTPLRPGEPIETYLFAMFDENLKGGDETENYYGLYTPDQTPKYQNPMLNFN